MSFAKWNRDFLSDNNRLKVIKQQNSTSETAKVEYQTSIAWSYILYTEVHL